MEARGVLDLSKSNFWVSILPAALETEYAIELPPGVVPCTMHWT